MTTTLDWTSKADQEPMWLSEPLRATMEPADLTTSRITTANAIPLAVNVLTLALGVGLVVALVFVVQFVREIKMMEERLASLGQFERRIASQVASVNAGFHSRMDEFTRDLAATSTQMNKLQSDIEAARKDSRDASDRLKDLEAVVRARVAAAHETLAAQAHEVLYSAPPPLAEAPPAKPRKKAPPAGPPQAKVKFERTVGPDGKVTFSKATP